MKKRYLIVPLLLTMLVSTAFAQTGAPSNVRVNNSRRTEMDARREVMRTEADAKRESMRVEAKDKRTAVQAKRVAFQQDVAKRKTERTAQVILATVGRLENIIARLESRIVKIRARGGVTSESEKFVTAARGNLFNARAAVNTFTNIELSSEKAADNFEKIRTAAAGAREHLRATHRNLTMAVRALASTEDSATVDGSAEQ